ncbi:inverse autotransporter beta domain-containing protein, partial [Enterobacter kobei]|uniref:inverse autotransporter beta domain-containing protein n=1 Tax=Enterobacter kobei TaxID=208224 RepID=UPI003CFABB2A
ALWSVVIAPVFPAYASFLLPDLGAPAAHSAKGKSAADRDDAQKQADKAADDAAVAKVAGQAQSLASMAAQGVTEGELADMARARALGMATGQVNSQLEHWLSGVGNARVQFDLDQDFSIRNSEFDILVPWYESADNLYFSQHSIHRTDDRTQLNTGAGIRHFGKTWMTGANMFLDYDLSRGHTRMGVGGELWRDYLKLGVNGYMRLSDWKSAPELNNDYYARPANGWDVRAEGWLPAYPQLGGTLRLEQYYGNEVALFSKDERHANPMAVTAGVKLNPFPLLTLNAEQSTGSSGINETRVGMQLNWNPSMSWSQMLDPDAVGGTRTLAGSRLDLVDRNNNIVLEYKKKELLRLDLYPHTEGRGGAIFPLVQSLKTKYPLKEIQWDAGEFFAAGGKITGTGTATRITLPAWRAPASARSTASAQNTYVITGTAWDTKGNASSPERAEVVVLANVISEANSTLKASPENIIADGKARSVITLTLNDAEKQPIAGEDV